MIFHLDECFGAGLLNTLATIDLEWLRAVPATAMSRRVLLQNYGLDGTQLRYRQTGKIPPVVQFISSPADAEAHYARKYTMQRVGYGVYRTETGEDDLRLASQHKALRFLQ